MTSTGFELGIIRVEYMLTDQNHRGKMLKKSLHRIVVSQCLVIVMLLFFVSGGDQQHEGDLQVPRRQRLLLPRHLLAAACTLQESR